MFVKITSPPPVTLNPVTPLIPFDPESVYVALVLVNVTLLGDTFPVFNVTLVFVAVLLKTTASPG